MIPSINNLDGSQDVPRLDSDCQAAHGLDCSIQKGHHLDLSRSCSRFSRRDARDPVFQGPWSTVRRLSSHCREHGFTTKKALTQYHNDDAERPYPPCTPAVVVSTKLHTDSQDHQPSVKTAPSPLDIGLYSSGKVNDALNHQSSTTSIVTPGCIVIPVQEEQNAVVSRPSVDTVESTAATKVYFETHFAQLMSKADAPRAARLKRLDHKLDAMKLSDVEKSFVRAQ